MNSLIPLFFSDFRRKIPEWKNHPGFNRAKNRKISTRISGKIRKIRNWIAVVTLEGQREINKRRQSGGKYKAVHHLFTPLRSRPTPRHHQVLQTSYLCWNSVLLLNLSHFMSLIKFWFDRRWKWWIQCVIHDGAHKSLRHALKTSHSRTPRIIPVGTPCIIIYPVENSSCGSPKNLGFPETHWNDHFVLHYSVLSGDSTRRTWKLGGVGGCRGCVLGLFWGEFWGFFLVDGVFRGRKRSRIGSAGHMAERGIRGGV